MQEGRPAMDDGIRSVKQTKNDSKMNKTFQIYLFVRAHEKNLKIHTTPMWLIKELWDKSPSISHKKMVTFA